MGTSISTHFHVDNAKTGRRRADAITKNEDGRLYFTEPLVEQMTMKEFLVKLNSESERKAPQRILLKWILNSR